MFLFFYSLHSFSSLPVLVRPGGNCHTDGGREEKRADIHAKKKKKLKNGKVDVNEAGGLRGAEAEKVKGTRGAAAPQITAQLAIDVSG